MLFPDRSAPGMVNRIARRLGLTPKAPGAPLSQILSFDRWPGVVYAIGDIHGRLDLLVELERRIVADAQHFSGEKWMILLGDAIDRGPHSATVLDHLSADAPAGLTRHCLAGNHERMMLRCLEDGRERGWLENGGFETLLSYGIAPERIDDGRDDPARMRRMIDSHVPDEHLAFLRALPAAICLPGWTFSHMPPAAGRAPARPGEHRRPAADPGPVASLAAAAERTVHGHRIVERVSTDEAHVNIDTGAYRTGRLTALRLAGPGDLGLLQTPGPRSLPAATRPAEE